MQILRRLIVFPLIVIVNCGIFSDEVYWTYLGKIYVPIDSVQVAREFEDSLCLLIYPADIKRVSKSADKFENDTVTIGKEDGVTSISLSTDIYEWTGKEIVPPTATLPRFGDTLKIKVSSQIQITSILLRQSDTTWKGIFVSADSTILSKSRNR